MRSVPERTRGSRTARHIGHHRYSPGQSIGLVGRTDSGYATTAGPSRFVEPCRPIETLGVRSAFIAVGVVFVTGVLWSVRLLAGDGPWPADSRGLLAAWLVTVTSVAVVGMLVGSARWARRLGVAVGGLGLLLALALPMSPLWWIGLIAAGAAIVVMVGPMTGAVVGALPAASGPPRSAIMLMLVLLAIPGVVAAAGVDGLDGWEWTASAGATVGLIWYAKALPMAIWCVRLLVPIGLLALAVGAPGTGRWVLAGAAVAVGVLAWRTEVGLAVRPLVRRVQGRPILPELVPGEVLDAAGLDERGRRRAGR